MQVTGDALVLLSRLLQATHPEVRAAAVFTLSICIQVSNTSPISRSMIAQHEHAPLPALIHPDKAQAAQTRVHQADRPTQHYPNTRLGRVGQAKCLHDSLQKAGWVEI